MSYNGWKNYETWVTALWIDNDEGTYRERVSMGQDTWDQAESEPQYGRTRKDVAMLDFADALKEWVEGMNPLLDDASLFTDLIGAALDEVDWQEIASNWLEDVEEGENEDEDATV